MLTGRRTPEPCNCSIRRDSDSEYIYATAVTEYIALLKGANQHSLTLTFNFVPFAGQPAQVNVHPRTALDNICVIPSALLTSSQCDPKIMANTVDRWRMQSARLFGSGY